MLVPQEPELRLHKWPMPADEVHGKPRKATPRHAGQTQRDPASSLCP